MEDCIFCRIIHGDAKAWKVYEDENVFAFLDIHPANKYHTLVIPKIHYVNVLDIPEEVFVELIKVVKVIVDLYNRKLGIKNVQIVNSSGPDAQQDVFHLHFHILPRHKGDNQDIKWVTHPEWVAEFDHLIAKIL